MMNTLQHASWHEAMAGLGTLGQNESMARHTTLGVGGPARWFFRPASATTMREAMLLIPQELPMLPLGRGSNMLIADEGFPGIVVDLGDLNSIEVKGQTLRAEAGARMSRVARICADHGLSGLEFLSTVPGDMGGGVAMNAGAFGQEIADTLATAEILLTSGETISMTKAELHMAYRRSKLPGRSLVLAASFNLSLGSPEEIRDRIRDMREIRGRTQPLAQPNCGSVFKNPEGDYAARLIEAAGLKGHAVGGARFSEVHANFIINGGEATSGDVITLIRKAQSAVQLKFDITLEPEVRIIGGKS